MKQKSVKNKNVIVTEATSATTDEIQIPSICQNKGKIKIAATWKTRVLKNEINAETSPSFSAVKNDEPKIENPASKKQKAKIKNAWRVIFFNSLS